MHGAIGALVKGTAHNMFHAYMHNTAWSMHGIDCGLGRACPTCCVHVPDAGALHVVARDLVHTHGFE